MEVKIQVIDDKGRTYEGTLMLSKGGQRNRKPKFSTKPGKKTKKVGPSDVIREELYQKNFFRTHKDFPQVEKQLNDSAGYHFKKGSILMALKGAEYLTRSGKRGAYKFVQKYPAQA